MTDMTPNQYRTAIAKLGLSQVKAALFLGVSPRQSRRWALGESPIPEGYAMLLRLMIRHGLTPVDVD
jgi:DNA-binding transcriptional regulator YiaG